MFNLDPNPRHLLWIVCVFSTACETFAAAGALFDQQAHFKNSPQLSEAHRNILMRPPPASKFASSAFPPGSLVVLAEAKRPGLFTQYLDEADHERREFPSVSVGSSAADAGGRLQEGSHSGHQCIFGRAAARFPAILRNKLSSICVCADERASLEGLNENTFVRFTFVCADTERRGDYGQVVR